MTEPYWTAECHKHPKHGPVLLGSDCDECPLCAGERLARVDKKGAVPGPGTRRRRWTPRKKAKCPESAWDPDPEVTPAQLEASVAVGGRG